MAQYEGSYPAGDAKRSMPGIKGISGLAVGVTVLASVLMVMLGIFHTIEGISAVANGSFFVVRDRYPFEVDVATWGWVHIWGGVIVTLAGFWLLLGDKWARAVAVVLAVLSCIGNFLSVPYYPVWSILLIGLDILVIWAVTTYGNYVKL